MKTIVHIKQEAKTQHQLVSTLEAFRRINQEQTTLFVHSSKDVDVAVYTVNDNVEVVGTLPMQLEELAKIVYDLNQAYCAAVGDKLDAWSDLPDTAKDGFISGVIAHLNAGPGGLDPEASHKAWLNAKLADGWSYGQTKDFEKKTHPAMLDYVDLPVSQKPKDFIFRQVIQSLAPYLVQSHTDPIEVLRDGSVENEVGYFAVPYSMPLLQVGEIWRYAGTEQWMIVVEPIHWDFTGYKERNGKPMLSCKCNRVTITMNSDDVATAAITPSEGAEDSNAD